MSAQSCRLATQGTAFVHNLICGSFTSVGDGSNNVLGFETILKNNTDVMDAGPRYTPYHVPHRTEIAGFMTILHGDNRFYNNIFIQKDAPGTYDYLYEVFKAKPMNSWVGTKPFDSYPTGEEYFSKFFKEGDIGAAEDRAKFYTKLPVYTEGNVFFNGAKPCEKEQNFKVDDTNIVYVEVKEKDGKYYLDTNIADYLPELKTPFISTEFLGEAFEPEQKFENPDGTEIQFDQDYYEIKRGINPTPGPFETKKGWALIAGRAEN